jgi:NAD(P)-dependent dehydrogenase (short-subunit alcohol dehydrogenase family)
MVAPPVPLPPNSAMAADELRGAVVVVTGVGRRGQAGEVVAAEFARHGASVVVVDRDDKVKERASDLSSHGTIHPFACDLTDPVAAGELSASVSRLAPDGVAAVVHMAGGYAEGGPVADTEPSAWHKLIAINLTTAFVATRAFLPLVRRARGTMVYFASTAALPGAAVTNMAAYAAAKGGVVTLMRAVAAEEKANGVRANALAPLAIRTSENLESMGKDRQYVDRETVAAWVLWLCSRAAGFVSGQVVRLG